MSELPATRLFKTFSYCLETVHFYSAEQVLRKDMKEKKPRIVVRDFLKHNFLDLLYECNGTGGTTSRREKSINGRRTHVNGSKELFTILNLSMFLSAKTVYCVYIWSFLLPFFSAECIILLLYTWKYKIYFIKDIWICLWKYKVLFVCGHLVTRFITRRSDPSFPGGARQHVETEGRIRECIHTVSLVQTTTKSQNSEPATARTKPVTGH